MGTPGPAPEVTLEDTLGVFADLDRPSTPLTASEVAEELHCTRRTVHRKLEKLSDRDDLETKKTGARSRIWWRPASAREAGSEAETKEQSEREAFGEFVAAVEDYAIFTLDADGRVATWNEGARRIKGYEREEIVGEHLSRFYTDGDVEAGVPEGNLATARDEGRIEDEGWRVRADGTQFWANVVITAIRDEDGELQGYAKVTRDMTERREYEQRLQRERDRTQELLETAPIPIAVQDEDGNTVMANDRAQETLGLTESEFVHGPENEDEWTLYDADGDPVDPEDMPMARVLAAGEPVYDETIAIESPDGDRTWLSVNAAPFTGSDGDEARVVVAGEDVTALKERERELETELSEVLGRISDAFYAVDDEWRFTHVNDRAAEILSQSEEALIGQELLEVFPDATDDVYWENLQRAMETQEPVSFEVHESGIDAWLEFNVYPSETGLSVYFRDVTDRKEYERELAKYGTIVETMNDGIYVKDEDGQFTMVNDAYAEMTGYDRETLIGEHASLVVDEETIAESNARIGDEADAPMEAPIETADGDTVPAEGTFSSLESGEEVGVVRDVTDRKEYERELERKERRYQAVFEDPNILVGLLEPDGTVLDINDTAMEYVDAEIEELVDEQFSETPWWESDDGIQSDVRGWVERAAAGEYVDFEADLTRPGGERYVLSGHFRPVTNDDGEVVSIIVSDRDITEQKEYQRDLERSEQRYRTLVENFPNGAVALVDDDLRYQTVGGSPIDVGSEGPSHLEGKTIREALTPDLADTIEPGYRAALEGESNTYEVELDGQVAEIQTYPVRDQNGEVFAALGMSQDITERVERERYLQDAKSRLEAATEAGAVGTWEWFVQEDELVTSPSFARKIGIDPEVAEAGISIEQFLSTVHEDDRERVERRIDEAVETTGEYQTEYRVWNADGEIRWVVARGHVKPDEDGNAAVFRGALTDVTQRKEYQRRVKESERRYRTLVENFPNGAVGLFDEDLTYTAVGGQFLDDADIPREERIGRSVYEIYPDELVESVEPHFQGALDGEMNSFEEEFRGRHLLAHTLPVRNADDEVFAGMLVVQDVTERREAQQELRESEAKFRMIAENLEEIVWMTTSEAEEFVYLNPAFEDVWGVEREELYDEPLSFLDVVDPDDRERVREQFTTIPEGEFDEEFRIHRPDGEDRWVHARGTEVHDEDSEMTRIVGIGEDVTERVERERELEELVDQLEESNERLERFAYVASHDLQEPLRMISNYLQLLERRYRDELDDEAEEFIDFAVDGAERMREMISDLLAYSRLDTEAEPFEPTDGNAVVDDVRDDLQLQIEETDAEITVKDLPTVEVDENQFEMVFQNLVSNAVKYSGDDPPRIEIGADRRDDEWVFSVADDGIGMEQSHTEDVFDVFNRLHTHDEYPGTGIGLAMCEKIVRHHGGDIWVESEPGEGSTFYFTIPVDHGGRQN